MSRRFIYFSKLFFFIFENMVSTGIEHAKKYAKNLSNCSKVLENFGLIFLNNLVFFIYNSENFTRNIAFFLD